MILALEVFKIISIIDMKPSGHRVSHGYQVVAAAVGELLSCGTSWETSGMTRAPDSGAVVCIGGALEAVHLDLVGLN